MDTKKLYLADGSEGIFFRELGVWYTDRKIDDISTLNFDEMTKDKDFICISDRYFQEDDLKHGTFIGTNIDPIFHKICVDEKVDLFKISYEDILKDCDRFEIIVR